MSTFEARRLANLAQNAKLLKEAAGSSAKMRKDIAPPPKPVTRTPKRKAQDTPQKTRIMPTRQSRRLAGANADVKEEDIKLENIPAELKERTPKRARTAADLKLEDLKVEGQRWSNSDALAAFQAQPHVRTFTDDDINDTTNDKLKSMRKSMNNLELYDGWVPNDIKITPERVYALTFHPSYDKPMVFAGDKKGTLGFFDASQETPEYPEDDEEDFDMPLPKIGAFEVHQRTISSIKIPMFDSNHVYTSSYDSSIRCLDLTTQVSTQLWQPADDNDDQGITCIDISPEAKDTIVFSTLDGSLGRFDKRTRKEAEIWNLTENKIGGFSLHPLQPHLVATASLDRTLKIWDMRMIKGTGELRGPSLLGEHVSRLSVSHASWGRGGQIATSSYDDTVKIYDMSDASKWKPGYDIPDSKMEPKHSIRHNNQTGRWVTILKPQWQANPGDNVNKFAISNMNRFVDIYDAEGEQLAQLDGDGITAVPAVAELHPVHNWVAGVGSSGKLCLWM
ncbi:WD40-repeat-containing domain protein [Xylariomycetidae sp. FL2044]|nr:WD40-repeat-containing domain protein [Xylariomycetidae sp. FL2044]